MRIISNVHEKDYYDHVGYTTSHEQTGKVWLRSLDVLPDTLCSGFPASNRTSEFSLTDHLNEVPMFSWFRHPKTGYDSDCYRVTSHVMLVAGKLYPFLRVDSIDFNSDRASWMILAKDHKISYHYTLESVSAVIARNSEEWFFGNVSKQTMTERKRQLELFFSWSGSAKAESWAIDRKIVTAVAIPNRRNEFILVNPKLSDYQFQSFMDPYTLYQELSMWVDGVLTDTEKIPEPSNKIKILSHGFDLKTSFRGK